MADGAAFRTLPVIERMGARALAPSAPVNALTNVPAAAAMVDAGMRRNLRELVDRDVATLVKPIPGLVRNFPFPTTPVPTPAPAPPVTPSLTPGNPFAALPHPNPGDRIKSDDFRTFSRCLEEIQESVALSASLFGRTLAEARPILAARQLVIERAMSVFGTTLGNPADTSLDGRRVVHVAPVALGEPRVVVVVSEAVESRRLTPNLINATHAEASERLRSAVGDATFPQISVRAGQLVGATLGDAARAAVTSDR